MIIIDNIEDELDVLRNAKDYIEKAVDELEGYKQYNNHILALLEDIRNLDEEINELDKKLNEQWKAEKKELENEYWKEQL